MMPQTILRQEVRLLDFERRKGKTAQHREDACRIIEHAIGVDQYLFGGKGLLKVRTDMVGETGTNSQYLGLRCEDYRRR